jgi:hypothetical protein
VGVVYKTEIEVTAIIYIQCVHKVSIKMLEKIPQGMKMVKVVKKEFPLSLFT